MTSDPEIDHKLDMLCQAMDLPAKKFDLGQVVATPLASTALTITQLYALVAKHRGGDWGVIDDFDRGVNEQHLADKENGARLHSVYPLPHSKDPNATVWVITDGLHSDEAVTTVLMPDDY